MKKHSPKFEIVVGVIIFAIYTVILKGFGMLAVLLSLIYASIAILLFCSKNKILKTIGVASYPYLVFMFFLPKQIKIGLNELASKNT